MKNVEDSGASLFLFFLIMVSIIWIILFTFRPSIVQYIERGEIKPLENAESDPARCFVGSLIISLIIIFIVWMFKSCT